jgi:2-polyprenyl-6-hydroxyphenyl methylase/3-demethylubiquinone-9 3-methyltransferase
VGSRERIPPLHQINPLRLEWINGLAPLAGQRVLDVGCGGGILADAMARKGADVWGSICRRSR